MNLGKFEYNFDSEVCLWRNECATDNDSKKGSQMVHRKSEKCSLKNSNSKMLTTGPSVVQPGDAMDMKQVFLKSSSEVVVFKCLIPSINKIDANNISFKLSLFS